MEPSTESGEHSTRDNLRESIKTHEGWRAKAYQDTLGIWTVGYGTNLQELEITRDIGEAWLDAKIDESYKEAERFPEWEHLQPQARRDVLVEMIYNMGAPRVAKFDFTLRAIRDEDYETAAKEMLDSRWARQVGNRAKRLSDQMRTGLYWNDDKNTT